MLSAPAPSSPSISALDTATQRRTTTSSRSLHSTWTPSGSNMRSRHRSNVHPTRLP